MTRAPVTAAVVVAAGASRRFGGAVSKLLVPWRGRPLLAWSLDLMARAPSVRDVVLVASEEVEQGLGVGPWPKLRAVVRGGAERQDSVAAGLAAVAPDAEVVLVHDGARPFATPALVEAVARAAHRSGAALPLLPLDDTVKSVKAGASAEVLVTGTLDRDSLRRAQTPQGFRADVLREAVAHAQASGARRGDDVGLVEDALAAGKLPAGTAIEGVLGEAANVKVTRPEDVGAATSGLRVGLGHDVHRLAPGRPFVLAGVDLSVEAGGVGPAGHSDGDALTHATCDALLGAAALGDIGQHFEDTDPAHAGRPSLEFLREVSGLITRRGWTIVNISAVVHLERPRLAPHADALREALAAAMGIPAVSVGLSAKRGEGLGAVGEGKALSCDVVALLSG